MCAKLSADSVVFLEGKWETLNGRSPLMLPRDNPFFELPLFRRTRDGRHVRGRTEPVDIFCLPLDHRSALVESIPAGGKERRGLAFEVPHDLSAAG